ncbi:sensor histidine kinase, partial [Vibrio diabolicus]|uniref:sensor histidine kinase n=2 Tax=Vibrionaceae TaxID=641 RepID=UPI00211B2581|nr:ATP-binding protein [Vibrio diabolicus]
KGPGEVIIRVKQVGDVVKVTVRDSGEGISQQVIDKVNQGTMGSHRIGLVNVHQRLALLYGKGLTIQRLSPGTDISFDLN